MSFDKCLLNFEVQIIVSIKWSQFSTQVSCFIDQLECDNIPRWKDAQNTPFSWHVLGRDRECNAIEGAAKYGRHSLFIEIWRIASDDN